MFIVVYENHASSIQATLPLHTHPILVSSQANFVQQLIYHSLPDHLVYSSPDNSGSNNNTRKNNEGGPSSANEGKEKIEGPSTKNEEKP